MNLSLIFALIVFVFAIVLNCTVRMIGFDSCYKCDSIVVVNGG